MSYKAQIIEMYKGHRKRLKSRFIKYENRSLEDYEILEMVLYSCFPRKDTKPLAKNLLLRFGSLRATINADRNQLSEIKGVTEGVIGQFKLLLDIFSRLELGVGEKINILSSWQAVVNYCRLSMGFKIYEAFRVLYLNKKNVLLYESELQKGTVDKVIIYPREIARNAINNGATAIILVHNHPSGDAKPSKEDIDITEKIIITLKPLNILVHDHLIIAKDQVFSFKNSGLLS